MNLYNDAIQLIKKEQYLLAEQKLIQMLKDGYTNDEINWTLGLLQIHLGKPKNALAYWNKIAQPALFQLEQRIEQVEVLLPKYTALYNQYNEALVAISNKDFDTAFKNIEDAIQFTHVIPLEIYEAYFNLVYFLGKNELGDELLANAPKHIVTAASIQKIHSLRKTIGTFLNEKKSLQEQSLELKQQVKSSRNVRNGILAGASTIIAGLAITIALFANNEETAPIDQVTSNTEQNEQTNSSPTLLEENSEKVTELELIISTLEQQLKEVNSKNEALLQKEQILLDKNIVVDSLISNAQKDQYAKGLSDYRKGRFEAAKTNLVASIAYEQDTYYADDAHYYLIQTKRQLQDETIVTDYERFISSELLSYQQSPYLDDVLLQYAQLLIAQQNNGLAIELLNRITDQFSNEWTSTSASLLLKQLVES